MTHVVHAACPHDCPDACGVLITVEDGRAIKIQGDPAHPVTRGFLCAKVARYLERVYSPARVLYPLRRVKPKGPSDSARQRQACSARDDSAFERITWDEALDEIAARFQAIVAEYGAEAILPYSYGGTLAALNNASMDRRFFHRLGASRLSRTICSEAGGEGLKSVVGAKLGTEPEQFRHSRLIIAWGANIHGNNIHLWPFIEEARRHGARLVVIDPYRTRTAACADWYLPINPATDVALALGMMHVIIGEGLYDADYVAQHTTGFDELRKRVRDYPPHQVAKWTGLAAEDVVKLARAYATTRPAVIRLNYGVQRCENGGMATRAIAMLPCITGSWREVGGGLQLSTSGAFPLDRAALVREDLSPGTRAINMVELGRALHELNDPPVKALFVYNSNPAAVCPDHNAVVRGLLRPGLFTVVHEQFLTDTCDYADIVLPATTFFEHKDLQAAYGHYYLQASNAAIAPLGECRSNVDTFRALAERMGFDDPCFRESVDQMIDAALASGHQYLQGITRERLERQGHVRMNLGFRNSDLGFKPASPHTQDASYTEIPNPKSKIPNVSLRFGTSDLEFEPSSHDGAGIAEIPNPKSKIPNVLASYLEFEPSSHDGAGIAEIPNPKSEIPNVLASYLEFEPGSHDGAGIAEIPNPKSEIPNVFFLPFADGNFPTSSGKAELYSAQLASMGLDPVAAFTPPVESRHSLAWNGCGAAKYPLELLARKADNFLNSTFCNLPANQQMVEREAGADGLGLEVLEMNAADAAARGICSGDLVRVFNHRGEVRLRAMAAKGDGRVQPGVVAARLNWAKLSRDGHNVNVLTSARLTDMGGGPTFYSTLVEVEKVKDL